ncbi:hypothetical protein GGR57DRAFT_497302 [Xylariaceae sp. FL1272]|nr:hypothetical protein GGR57DRAFT_497302 [Xylariaceae sp. FL1272]
MIFLLFSSVALTTATSIPEPAAPTTLLIDARIPVLIDGRWHIMSAEEHRELRKRDEVEREHKAATATTTFEFTVSTVTASATTTTTTAAASPLPSPFDGALAANFSSDTCPTFINAFLSSEEFKACYPVSLLLQGSNSFFQAEKELTSITQVLDAACAANVTSCTDYLDDLATQLISSDNCGKDYKDQNAIVVEAYQGMTTYKTIYEATCLMANSTTYCFASAVTNVTTASNIYLYYLPLNSSLPETAVPACNLCTRQTMEIYQAATSDRKADISYTYEAAAKQIDSICGETFVNTSLSLEVTESGGNTIPRSASPSLLMLSLLFMTASHWLL